MFCQNCGTKLPDDSVFCPSCGNRVKAAPAPEVRSAVTRNIREEAPPPRKKSGGGFFKLIGILTVLAALGYGLLFVIGLFQENTPPVNNNNPPANTTAANSQNTGTADTSASNGAASYSGNSTSGNTPSYSGNNPSGNTPSYSGNNTSGTSANQSSNPQGYVNPITDNDSYGQYQNPPGGNDYGQYQNPPGGNDYGQYQNPPGNQDYGQYGNTSSGQNGAPPAGYDYDQNGNLVPLNTNTQILELYPDGDPAFSDFDWYESTVLRYGVPDGAVYMDNSDLNGPWKYCFMFDRENKMGSKMTEIGYAQVTVAGTYTSLYVYPTFMSEANGFTYEENAEEVGYEPFEGNIDDGYIYMNGNGGTLSLTLGYQYNDVQYALGSFITASGVITDVLLVRP